MIILIRKRLKGRGFKIVLWTTIFSLTGILSLSELIKVASGEYSWVAKVDSQEIAYNDFIRMVHHKEELIRFFREQYGPYADILLKSMNEKSPRQMAFDQLIQNALLSKVAEKLSIPVSEETIGDILADPEFLNQWLGDLVPSFVIEPTGTINVQMLRSYLHRLGLTMSDLEERIAAVVRQQHLIKLIDVASYVPQFELKAHYVTENVDKSYSMLIFPLDDFIKQEQEKVVSTEDLTRFYDQQNAQAKRYLVPEKRSGKLWTFDAKNYGITVDDDDIKSYYDTHKVRLFIESPTKIQVRRICFKVERELDAQGIYEKAQKVREELLADSSTFAQKAQDISDDAESAKQGGLLPFFSKGEQDKVLERAAFLLKEDGDMSPVIKTDKGFEIIQRVDRKRQTFKSLASVKNEIKGIVLNKKFKELFVADMEGLLEQDLIDEKAFGEFIKQRGGRAKDIESIIKNDSKQAQKLFSLKKKTVAFFVDDSVGHAIQLTDIQKKYIPSLESIKDTVKHDMNRDYAMKKRSECLEEARKQATQKPLDEVAKELNVQVKQLGWIKPDDTKRLDALRNEYAIPGDIFTHLEKKGSLTTHDLGEQSYIIRLDAIKPLDEKLFEEKKEKLLVTLEGQQARRMVDGFVASLCRNATIKTNESLLHKNDEYSI